MNWETHNLEFLFVKDLRYLGRVKWSDHFFSKIINTDFGLKKWGFPILKGKIYHIEWVTSPNRKIIRDVENGGFKYVGFVELDKVKGDLKEFSSLC